MCTNVKLVVCRSMLPTFHPADWALTALCRPCRTEVGPETSGPHSSELQHDRREKLREGRGCLTGKLEKGTVGVVCSPGKYQWAFQS